MNHIEKKKQLEKLIADTILPLIDNDYVLYGLPYHNNVGDVLIWEGERELLKHSGHKCVGVCSLIKYPDIQLPENVIILIHGGGYFGDVWRDTWEQALDGIRNHRNNKIIMLPQSIAYTDEHLRNTDAEFLAQFPNLIIMTRDRASYNYAMKYFRNQVKLVPDMAFCINKKLLRHYSNHTPRKNALLFNRTDKELANTDTTIPEISYDVADWAPIEHVHRPEKLFRHLLKRANHLHHISNNLRNKAVHYLYKKIYRWHIIDLGMCQLNNYKRIYTTRLHAMILGTMCGREIFYIDNNNKKISAFYNTWLSDCDNVHPA